MNSHDPSSASNSERPGNERPDNEPSGIGDDNVVRMLQHSYRPEMPAAEFAERLQVELLAEARRRAATGEAGDAATPRAESVVTRRWKSLAIRAGVLAALAAIVTLAVLYRPTAQEVYHDGDYVWINGRPYAPTKAEDDQPQGSGDEKPFDLAASSSTTNVSTPPIGEHGLSARGAAAVIAAEPLAQGATLVTRSGERRRLALEDGSTLFVNENTSLTVAAERRISLTSGEVYVEVAPRTARSAGSLQQATFVVATPQRQVSALGTKFAVRVDGEETDVVVAQGKVEVEGLDAPLVAGQETRLANVGSKKTPTLAASATKSASATKEDVHPAERLTHRLAWTRELLAAAESPLVPRSEYAGGALVAVDEDGAEAHLSLRRYHVDVHIEDGFARTTIDQTYFNHLPGRLEGTFYFPLPADASISRLAMYVGGRLMEGGMAERDYARQVFETIKYRALDPALLEWIDGSTFKMRVFPLEGRQEKRIILSYTQRLEPIYDRTTYRFPAGHNLGKVNEWSTKIRLVDSAAIEWRCPSHQLQALAGAGDVLLEAKESNTALDRDMVLELRDNESAAKVDNARFSAAEHEGARYLMVRWQPELKAPPKRPRRDWVFLFETSADRNPLLARTQIDVIRNLLENAEHDDTFAIVAAGSRAAVAAKPQAATPENTAAAVELLEQSHLIGALDLEQAFSAVTPLVEAAKNPVLVHVGTGIPVLGRREQDKLVGMISDRARYVGVGVGKRYNRRLMRQAASRSGGYVTQINPDEEVAWRARDLLAVLDGPRLYDVQVAADGGQTTFLTDAAFLARGEELYAIARLEKGTTPPKQVVVRGKLDGKAFRQELPVAEVRHSADYLPRMWARLEIDRLLADSGAKHRAEIVALSKAMYVMSPFTSLLVLENDEMYEQYKVDRGRQDHWALYRCPERIDVKEEPLPAGPPRREEQAIPLASSGKTRSLDQVLRSVLVRVPASLNGNISKRARRGQTCIAWRLVSGLSLRQYIERYGSESPRTLNALRQPAAMRFRDTSLRDALAELESKHGLRFEFRGDYRDFYFERRLSVEFNGTRLATALLATLAETGLTYYVSDEVVHLATPQNAAEAVREMAGVRERAWRRNPLPTGDLDLAIEPSMFGSDVPMFSGFIAPAGGGAAMADFESLIELITRTVAPDTWNDVGGPGYIEGFEGNLSLIISQTQEVHETVDAIRAQLASKWGGYIRPGYEAFDFETGTIVPWDVDNDGDGGLDTGWIDLHHLNPFGPSPDTLLDRAMYQVAWDSTNSMSAQLGHSLLTDMYEVGPASHYSRIDRVAFSPDGRVILLDDSGSMGVIGLSATGIPSGDLDLRFAQVEPSIWRQFEGRSRFVANPSSALRWAAGSSLNRRRAPLVSFIFRPLSNNHLLYRRPKVEIGPDFFTDLVAFAPGLNTTAGDLADVAEREAKLPHEPRAGTIAPEARRLIEAARRIGWQRVKRADSSTESETVIDGQGRFRSERRTADGLRETVVSDGRSLWHLYPELGLGARRVLSRRQRAAALSLAPWLVQPAEDLARGADLRVVGPRTVAVVPHRPDEAPSNADAKAKHFRLHLVFAADGRLAERRVVEMPSGKTRLTVSYAADGLVRVLDAERREKSQQRWSIQPAAVPDLRPNARELVILPLPLRRVWHEDETKRDEEAAARAQHQYPPGKLIVGKYSELTEDEALQLLAYDLSYRSPQIAKLIRERFFAEGDHRLGLYTLLLACSGQRDADSFDMTDDNDPLLHHAGSPLAQFFAQSWGGADDLALDRSLNGSAGGFLQQLHEFQRQYSQWRERSSSGWNEADVNRLLDFAASCNSSRLRDILLRCLEDVRGTSFGDNPFGASERADSLRRRIATAYLQQISSTESDYARRYENARWLAAGGDVDAAKRLLLKLHRDACASGVVPPIDVDFRRIVSSDDDPAWPKMMHEAAQELIDNHNRPAATALAWQCHQLGDLSLADELLDQALADLPRKETIPVVLAAIDFLVHTGRSDRADALLEILLVDDEFSQSLVLGQLGVALAERQGKTALALVRRQQLVDRYYAGLTGKIDVERLRRDYGALLAQYKQLAQATAALDEKPSLALAARIVQAADRWRSLDVDATPACAAAAELLASQGIEDLAWDYLTSPLADRPNEAKPWTDLAETLTKDGRWQLADRAFATAFEAEGSNAEILWRRAELLDRHGRHEEAQRLYRQIAETEWQPRFEYLQRRAKGKLKQNSHEKARGGTKNEEASGN